MKSFFFITGLPRSRTAWLANLLTWGNAVCFHEAERGFQDIGGYLSFLKSVDAEVVGDSSCAILSNWERISGEFPEARWVLVERDAQEAFDSARREFPIFDIRPEVFRAGVVSMNEIRGRLNPLVVNFQEVSQRAAEIAGWCRVQCSSTRLEILNQLNVQINLPTAKGAERWRPKVRNEQDRTSEEYLAMVRAICEGDVFAAKWIVGLFDIILLWDHLVDGDQISTQDADRAMSAVLLEWASNPFYLRYGQALTPVICNSILSWRTGDTQAAYKGYIDVPLAVAFLIGGSTLAAKWSGPIREKVDELIVKDSQEDNIWQ